MQWILFISLILAVHLSAHDEDPKPGEWKIWAPRVEIRPSGMRLPDGRMLLTSTPNTYGGWARVSTNVHPGDWFRFGVDFQGEGLTKPRNQVLVRLDWLDIKGNRVGDPEFAWRETSTPGWTHLEETVEVPTGTAAANLQLLVYNAGDATVIFRDPVFVEVKPPAARPVRVAAVNYRPAQAPGGEANAKQLATFLSNSLTKPTDLIVVGEGITVVGSSKKYEEIAEAADGPTVRALGEVARAKNSWIVAGIYERDGVLIYNTAVLIDRAGKLTGKYRKVYLPREEIERGLSPGHELPVFTTDFGKLGLMVCYDVFFAEPAKALAMQGAEIIAMPIWGGDETLAKARSIEGRVFLLAAGYDHPTYVQDPYGVRVSEATKNMSIAWAEIDLSRRYRDKFLGDMRARRMRETRTDLVVFK